MKSSLKNTCVISSFLPIKVFCLLFLFAHCLAFPPAFAVGVSLESAGHTNRMIGGSGVTARISQGTPVVNSSEFPWMASLRSEFDDLFCGAVVVDSYHVLTAAHCVAQFAPNRFKVYVASKSHRVDRVWLSYEFRWSRLDRDIAVVRLETPLTVESLPIATGLDQLRLQEGDQLTVLGFGQSVTDGPLTNRLAQGQVPFVSAQTCSSRWQSAFPSLAPIILKQGVCASGLGGAIDTCTGDSGGPLLMNQSGQWRLLGLTSFGEPQCGGAQKPSVYSNVNAQLDIVQKALNGEAYYANWTQVLVDEDNSAADVSTTFEIINTTEESWRFSGIEPEASSLAAIPFQPTQESSCLDSELLPQQSCNMTVVFKPNQGGFYANRLLLQREGMSPLWIDLQGFAFDFVPETQFGQQGVFGFTGGESVANAFRGDGISNGGYLQWDNIIGLDSAETYIGTEVSQELTLFFEFEPSPSDRQIPSIDIRVLSAFGEEISLTLDRTVGWQRHTVFLEAEDFLYVRIQAPGQGMNGQLKFDVLAQSDTLDESKIEMLTESPNMNQSDTNTRNALLESGGSVSLLGFFLGIALLWRCRVFNHWCHVDK